MIRLPQSPDRRWKVSNASKFDMDIVESRNLNFDNRGFVSLANRAISIYSSNNNSQMGVGKSVFYRSSGVFKLATDEGVWNLDLSASSFSITQDTLSSGPSGSDYSSGALFNGSWVVSELGDISSFNGSAWTDQSVTLASSVGHPLAVFKNKNTLAVGNGNQVKQFNTSYAETTNMTIPSEFEVSSLGYNSNLMGIGTWVDSNAEAYFFVWDGNSAAANYGFPVGSNRIYFVAPYQSTFVVLTGKGQLLQWTPSGMQVLDELPVAYSTALLAQITGYKDVCNDLSFYVDGDVLLFNISTRLGSAGSEAYGYLPSMPSGTWCYDPHVGLYHRHALSMSQLIASTAVVDSTYNTIEMDGEITKYAQATYFAGATPVGGLTDGTTYYTDPVTSVSTASEYTPLLYNTLLSFHTLSKIDATHFLSVGMGADSDGFAQVLAVDTTTWAVSTAAAEFEFDTQKTNYVRQHAIDSSHALVFWAGDADDGFTQVLAVDTSTWEVSTAGAVLEYDTARSTFKGSAMVDTTHALLFYRGDAVNGYNYLQTFSVNTSTWAVTTASARLGVFAAGGALRESVIAIDSAHFLATWENSASPKQNYAQVVAVNTSTWAVTTVGAEFEISTSAAGTLLGGADRTIMIDSAHALYVWENTAHNMVAQVLAINTSTWAVTTASAVLTIDASTTSSNGYPTATLIDTNHVAVTHVSGDALVGDVIRIDTATWELSIRAVASVMDGQAGGDAAIISVSGDKFIGLWDTDYVGYGAQARVFTIGKTYKDHGFTLSEASPSKFIVDTYGQVDDVVLTDTIDSSKFVAVYQGDGNDLQARVLTVNTSTWAVTTASAGLYELSTGCGYRGDVVRIDSNHYVTSYIEDNGSLVPAVGVFSVDTSTWAIATSTTPLIVSTATGTIWRSRIFAMDANHFIRLYDNSSPVPYTLHSVVVAVNTSTWALSTASAQFTIDTTSSGGIRDPWGNAIDSSHALIVWHGGENVNAQILTVDTSTWAVSTGSDVLVVNTGNPSYSTWPHIAQLDDPYTHLCVSRDGVVGTKWAILSIDSSTWEISTLGAGTLLVETGFYNFKLRSTQYSNKFFCPFTGPGTDGYAVTFEVDTTTWTVSTSSADLEFDTGQASDIGSVKVDDNHYLLAYRGADNNSTYATVISMEDTTSVKSKASLSSSVADVTAGTTINLTSDGSTGDQVFQIYPQLDFGQFDVDHAGVIASAGDRTSEDMVISEYLLSSNLPTSDMTSVDAFGIVARNVENRGSFTTGRLTASGITDMWQNVSVKFSGVHGVTDAIIVKTRTSEKANYPIVVRDTEQGVWVTPTSLTTTADLSAVEVGEEVFFTAGVGGGYTAHITAISSNAGVYTISIDENVRGSTAGDKCWFIVDNWVKTGSIAPADFTELNGGYKAFPIMREGKWLQIKLELRGIVIKVEEIVVNSAPYRNYE